MPYFLHKLFAYLAFISSILWLFPTNLLSQSGTLPYIKWQSPQPAQSFALGEYIQLLPETGTFDPAYWSIENSQNGWVKFKWGYDAKNLWTPPQNVIAGGNNTLEIVLKDISGTADWSKIRLHPQGNANAPLSLSKYIKTGENLGKGWIKINIPLADFYAGINFEALSYMEFPYSANAGAFHIAVSSLRFVGGSQPFAWFDQQKHDNIYDGGNAMTAQYVAPKYYQNGIEKVVFQYNDQALGVDYTYPFGLLWINPELGTHQLKAIAHARTGAIATSTTLPITITDNSLALVDENNKPDFPSNWSSWALQRYRPIMAQLRQAALSKLPYSDKQSRAQLNRATAPPKATLSNVMPILTKTASATPPTAPTKGAVMSSQKMP
jgi:hypothetical protein